MMKTVLIVSYESDVHAQHLISRMNEFGVRAILWDVSKLATISEVGFDIGQNTTQSKCTILIDGVGNISDSLAGVYWRRAQGEYGRKSPTPMEKYIHLETEVAVRSLFHFLPSVNWVSPPENDRLACRKPVQLDVAQRLGLRVPMTCITNSPASVKMFIDSLNGRKLTMKPTGTAFMHLASDGNLGSGENKVVFTKLVEPELVLANQALIRNCTVIFQEAIIKDFDLRVTVVDGEVFAAVIHHEGCDDPTNLDWKNYEGRRVYQHHKLPDDICSLCIRLLQELGLRFGCIDLGFSKKEGYTFFEVNPQGQWLPSEVKLGYDISGAIFRALTS